VTPCRLTPTFVFLGAWACASAGGDAGADALPDPGPEALFEVGDAADALSPQGGYLPCPADPAADCARPEHPRPDACRALWKNLNGTWRFAFDPDDVGEAEAWQLDPDAHLRDTIEVPFPWQSPASGVGEDREGLGWYARTFALGEAWRGPRVHLVIGAADWEATVWLNGKGPWTHEVGYGPWRLDVTDALRDGANTLVVRVNDPGPDPEVPHGKQGTPWYTNVGGIWQTVWLEATPEAWIEALEVDQPLDVDANPGELDLRVRVVGAGTSVPAVTLWREGTEVPIDARVTSVTHSSGQAVVNLRVPFDEDWIWDPSDPRRVPLTVQACVGDAPCDRLTTAIGVRAVGTKALPDAGPNRVITVNGRPHYVRGVLWQGYHPDTLYAYPSEAAIVADLEAAKAAGFSLVRLHIKPEDPLVLWHADRLGLLVDDDAVNLGTFPFHAGDSDAGRARWEASFRAQVARDRNHPSILWWTLFNETWGLTEVARPYDEERQAWVRQMVTLAHELLPGHLIEDMSPTEANRDHLVTDLLTWHFYRAAPDDVEAHLDEVLANVYVGSPWLYTGGVLQDAAYPLINTEFGPFSVEPFAPEAQRDRDVSDAFRWMVTAFRARPAISGYVFTELYDVEFERNGWLDYERTWKQSGYEELMGCGIAGLQQEWAIGTDDSALRGASPGQTVRLTPWVSTLRPELVPDTLSWSLWASGGEASLDQGELAVAVTKAGRTELPTIDLDLPASGGAFVWRARRGDACTFLPVLALPQRVPGWHDTAPGERSLALPPAAFEARDLQPGDQADPVADATGAIEAMGLLGGGGVSTTGLAVDVPVEAAAWDGSRPWSRLRLTLELAANQPGMPQTDSVPWPSTVGLALDGQPLTTVELADDWADARGVISHATLPRDHPSGGHGERVVVEITDPTVVDALRRAAEDGTWTLRIAPMDGRGVMLYGLRSGRYAFDPTLTRIAP